MKKFEEFVNHVVSTWKIEKERILEKAGLSGVPNRISGDIAENYIKRRIDNLTPKYNPIKSAGSQTPSDVYSVARRNGYWHIMLIQVKSSKEKKSIYKLTNADIKEFRELAKFLKNEIKDFEPIKSYKNKPIVISTGYAGVWNVQTKRGIRPRLINAELIDLYKLNCAKLNMISVKTTIIKSHKL